MDISYPKVCGTYYLCAISDGSSRHTVHWEIRGGMTEVNVEMIPQCVLEGFPR